MYDKSDVGLVDAHAESYGGDDNVDFFKQKGVLIFRACGSVETCMIWECLDVVDCQKFGEFFNFFAAETVDNA